MKSLANPQRSPHQNHLLDYRNVQREITRHGKEIYYFRRRGGKRMRLRGLPGTDDFNADYMEAVKRHEDLFEDPDARRLRLRCAPVVNALVPRLSRVKARAQKKGVPFELDEAWVRQEVERNDGRCALTGMNFTTGDGPGRAPFTPSFDRIDPRKGYTKDNTRIVIWAINVMLGDWGEDVFENVVIALRKHRMAKRHNGQNSIRL
jgi:hypothetical protein